MVLSVEISDQASKMTVSTAHIPVWPMALPVRGDSRWSGISLVKVFLADGTAFSHPGSSELRA
jgi:hypothetical protein